MSSKRPTMPVTKYTREENDRAHARYMNIAPEAYFKAVAFNTVGNETIFAYPIDHGYPASLFMRSNAGLEVKDGHFRKTDGMKYPHSWNFDRRAGFVVDVTAAQFDEWKDIIDDNVLIVQVLDGQSEDETMKELQHFVKPGGPHDLEEHKDAFQKLNDEHHKDWDKVYNKMLGDYKAKPADEKKPGAKETSSFNK